MGMNIEHFRQIAQTGTTRVVAQQGQLVNGTQSWFGRAVSWLTGSGKTQNNDVRAALQSVLTKTYGRDVALSAMSERFGANSVGNGKPLSARDIRQVLDTAHQRSIQDQKIAAMFTGLNHLQDGPVKTTLNSAVSNLGISLDVLSQSPMSTPDIVDYRDLVQAQKDVLTHHLGQLNGLQDVPHEAQELLAQVKQETQQQIQQLDQKLAYVAKFERDDPVSEKAVAQARAEWANAAVAVLNEEIDKCKGTQPEKAQALTQVRDGLLQQSHDEVQQARTTREQNLEGRLQKFPKELETTLENAFKAQGISTKGLHGRIDQAHIKELNEHGNWTTLTGDIRFAYKGQMRHMQSQVRPGCEMGPQFHYEQHQGVCSQTSTERTHAVNLWESSLKMGDRTVFHGIRHGIHSAYGISDPGERRQANLSRATESVKAVVVSNPELLQRAQNAGPDDVVRVPMTSISLVTPDAWRYYTNSKHSNERQQLMEQTQAWQTLNSGPVQLEIPDGHGGTKTVKVQPEVIPLNFGVNTGALQRGMPVDLAGGWSKSNELNEPGLKAMFGSLRPGDEVGGRVGEFIRGLPQDDPRRQTATKLVNQVRQMWQDGSYMQGGTEPYKMVKRLAVLASMVDGQVLWNCKSGKDRTGELDAEAKFLAAQIELDGDVPEPDQEMGPEERQMFREFTLHSQNLEVQKLNTGIGGYKTPYGPVSDQLGDPHAKEYHKGGSHYVKA